MALPILAMLVQFAFAETPAAHGDSAMRDYQAAGGSPMADVKMHQNINPKAPPMTEAEFDKGKQSSSSVAPAVTAYCARARPASH